jgi:RHS repeat-associated protein
LAGHPVAFTQDLGSGIQTFYVHTNARGDVVCITDDAMNWVKKYTYDPWGRITGETNKSSEYEELTCPYAYAGYFRDSETGLYYMPARYYSPFQRRFLTKDPEPGSKSNPITLNPYQYCENNPMNNVDPTGQFSMDVSALEATLRRFQSDMAGMMLRLGGLDNAVSRIRAGAALMSSGARGLAHAGAMISSGTQTALAGMRSMLGGLGMALGGVSMANAGVSGLASINFGSMAAMGIRGGVATGSPQQIASQNRYMVTCAVTTARAAAFRRYADELFSNQPGFWDTILYNPVANIVIGTSEMVIGGIAILGTEGLATELAAPVVLDGANRFVKGIYKLGTGDWTGEKTEEWWPIP